MRQRGRWRAFPSVVAAAAIFGACAPALVGPAEANWFTRIVKEAGDIADSGLDAGKIAIQRGAPRSVGRIADAVQRIKKRDKQAAVVGAAAVGPGEWTFVNAAGEVFTAANADELARVRKVLLPDADPRRATKIVVSQTALFGDIKGLTAAFPDAELAVAYGRDKTYALRGIPKPVTAEAPAWRLRVRSNVDLALSTRANMTAALEVLERKIRRDKLTVMAVRQSKPSPGARPRASKDAAGIAGLEVAEADVAAAMAGLRGRTVVLTGRISGDTLTYRTAVGFDRELALAPIREAAARNDVTLLLVNSPSPRQPGVRNWLWQKASVSGLDDALKQPDLAGLVDKLAEGSGRMVASVEKTGPYRTVLVIEPEPSSLNLPGSGLIGDITATVISETTGNLLTRAIEMDATSAARQDELDWRLIPLVPSVLQLGYLVSFVLGLFGLPFLRVWWRKVWPPEMASEYASRVGLFLARVVRGLVFLIVFLPLAGIPAAIANFGYSLWGYIMLPFRVLFWIASKFRRRAA
jgi:hypothetical protein